jgi:hypothetical protein
VGVAVVFLLVIGGSLIPALRDAKPEEFARGSFNANAEAVNGRLAMLGILGMMINEYGMGHALFKAVSI